MNFDINIRRPQFEDPIEIQVRETTYRGGPGGRRETQEEMVIKAKVGGEDEIFPFLLEQLSFALHGHVEEGVDEFGPPFTVTDCARPLALTDIKEVVGPRVYFIQGGPEGLIKIGHSTQLFTRFSALQACSPVELSVLLAVSGSLLQERKCHAAFRRERRHGEWFRPSARLLAFIERLRSGEPLSLVEAAEIEEQDQGPDQ